MIQIELMKTSVEKSTGVFFVCIYGRLAVNDMVIVQNI